MCFVSFASIAFITNVNQTFEPTSSTSVPKLTKEKIAHIEEVNKTKAYFKKYLMKKYPLYEKHTDLILNSVFKEAEIKNISPLLIIAVIEVESSCRFDAISNVGALGIMQVYEPRLSQEEAKKLFDPEYNIQKGTEKLSNFLKAKNGNLQLALGMYLGAQDATYNAKIMELIGRYYVALQTVDKKGVMVAKF